MATKPWTWAIFDNSGVRVAAGWRINKSFIFISSCMRPGSRSFASVPKGCSIWTAILFNDQRMKTCIKPKIAAAHGVAAHCDVTNGVISQWKANKASHVWA